MQPGADFPRDVTDRMIRESLRHPANLADLVSQVVPHLAAGLDFSNAQLVPRDFLTADWHGREADLPFEVPLRAGAPGFPALVFVLIEHQSDTDALLPLRMLFCTVGYWARQWQQWHDLPRPRGPLRLSPVIPIVLYTATRPWGSNTTLADLMAGPAEFHTFVQGWQPLMYNLSEQAPQALLAGGPWMQFLAVVRTADGGPELFRTTLEAAGHNLFPLAAAQAARWAELLRVMFEYALWRRPVAEQADILDALRRTSTTTPEGEAMADTIAEALMARGEQRGELRSARQMLRDALEVRLGSVPDALAQQINAITDLERLRQAHRRVVGMKEQDEFTL